MLDADSNIIAISDTLGFFEIHSSEEVQTLILRKYGYLDTVINVTSQSNTETYQLYFDRNCKNRLTTKDFQLIAYEPKPDTLTFILNGIKYRSVTTYYTYNQLTLVNGYEMSDFNCCNINYKKIKRKNRVSTSFVKSEYTKGIAGYESAEICLVHFKINDILKIYTSR